MSMYGRWKDLGKGKRANPVLDKFNPIYPTQQHRKDEFNLNFLVPKFGAARLASVLSQSPSRFGDISGLVDYKTSLDNVSRARDLFMELPSALRTRFENDPANLISFLNDPSNRTEAVSLGLLTAPVVDEALRKDTKLPKDPSTKPPVS